MLYLPYLLVSNLKQVKVENQTSKEVDEYEVVALAKRLGITFEEMKQMSYISLMNILLSSVDSDDTQNATQDDIDRMFG